jgi:hypothetical protein
MSAKEAIRRIRVWHERKAIFKGKACHSKPLNLVKQSPPQKFESRSYQHDVPQDNVINAVDHFDNRHIP